MCELRIVCQNFIEQVVQVNERSVLEQKAYMLFYVRDRKNIVSRKPADVQKENLKVNVNGKKTCSIVSQQPKGHAQSCQTENGVQGADSATVVKQNDVVVGGLSKEICLKETSIQPGRVSVPKKDALLEPASRAPLPKNSAEVTVPNPDQGKSLEPLNVKSNGVSHETKNNAAAASLSNLKENGTSKTDVKVSLTTLPNCNGSQSSATNKLVTSETSQKVIGCFLCSVNPFVHLFPHFVGTQTVFLICESTYASRLILF